MKLFSERNLKLCGWAALSFVIVDLGLIFFYAPLEKTQGFVQKIFYWHVSSAFAMYAGFISAAIFSLFYLIDKSKFWDHLSEAGVKVGLLFCSLVLISGPLWAKPVWGTWWSWDPRLTTTLILWLVFITTLFIRSFFEGQNKGRIFASILTLLGVLDIPLIMFSVKLWRGIHPTVISKEDGMPFEMRLTFLCSVFTVLFLAYTLFGYTYRYLEKKNGS